ncbi:MAG: murein L,D-transpeptidase family protein [Verrucomicrobiota bacterium]
MRTVTILVLFFATWLSACRGKGETGKTMEESESPAVDSSLPGSQREAAAARRVTPELRGALEAMGMSFGAPVYLRAFKEEKELEVWVKKNNADEFGLFRTYKIARQSGGLGPKLTEGDGQVPEGFYFVPPGAMKPDSVYHLAFNVGFPNAFDQSLSRTGSNIMVHGNKVSVGCLAMTDEKIEEIYTLCSAAHEKGQAFFRIHIFPFRMTDMRLQREKENQWFGFWSNLKEINDQFEKTKIPPNVTVQNGRYVFDNR